MDVRFVVVSGQAAFGPVIAKPVIQAKANLVAALADKAVIACVRLARRKPPYVKSHAGGTANLR